MLMMPNLSKQNEMISRVDFTGKQLYLQGAIKLCPIV